MIHIAKAGDEEREAKGLSRRGFLRCLLGGAAAAAAPTKTFVFFGNILRRPALDPRLFLCLGGGVSVFAAAFIAGPILISGKPILKGKIVSG